MIFELMNNLTSLVLLALSFSGFGVVFYIAQRKRKKATMVCPLRGKCDAVVYSKYARFLGIDLTTFGLGYYGVLSLAYILKLALPSVPPEFSFIVLGLSVGGLLFSIYLTAVQAFVLRQWCTWCVISALVTTLLATIGLLTTDISLVALLAEYKGLIVIVHALAAAVGVGATTVTDVSFTRYLKDFRIDQVESKSMEMYSQIIWLALGLLIVTGIGLYLPNTEILNESSKFLVKVIAVGVITLNGVLLNIFVTPRLTKMSFAAYKKELTPGMRRTRSIIFASGGVSIVSWYLVFILGSLRSIPLTFGLGLVGYAGLVLAAIIGSQLYELQTVKKANQN